jgi:hypothetical protein
MTVPEDEPTIPKEWPAADCLRYNGADESYETRLHFIKQYGQRNNSWVVRPIGADDVMFRGSLHECIQAALEVEADL